MYPWQLNTTSTAHPGKEPTSCPPKEGQLPFTLDPCFLSTPCEFDLSVCPLSLSPSVGVVVTLTLGFSLRSPASSAAVYVSIPHAGLSSSSSTAAPNLPQTPHKPYICLPWPLPTSLFSFPPLSPLLSSPLSCPLLSPVFPISALQKDTPVLSTPNVLLPSFLCGDATVT